MSAQNSFPAPGELLPQSGKMNLLDDVVRHDPEITVCRFHLDPDHVFYRDGGVPAWFGLEFMGQCSHLHYLLKTHERGQPVTDALFLGGRKLMFSISRLEPGIEYLVSARQYGTNERYFSSESVIRTGNSEEKLIEGRLSALMLDEGKSIGESFPGVNK